MKTVSSPGENSQDFITEPKCVINTKFTSLLQQKE